MVCQECGAGNREAAKFCNKCGRRLAVVRGGGAGLISSPPGTPRPGDLAAVPIIRKLPSAPPSSPLSSPPPPSSHSSPPSAPDDSVRGREVPKPSPPSPPQPLAARQSAKPPAEPPPASLPQPFFTSMMPAQKNKQHQRLGVVTLLVLLVTAAVFALAYYAFIKY
jgi:hypothetical protein